MRQTTARWPLDGLVPTLLALAHLALTVPVCSAAEGRRASAPPARVAPAAAASSVDEGTPLDTRLRVFKTERRLELWLDGRLELETAIGLGWKTSGPKREKDDGRTPGGEYFVCGKNPVSRHYLSLSLSYPNEEDAAAGLRGGRITRAEHDEILEALDAGDCPRWDTALGGRIFLHGDHEEGDWTMGCVAVDNHAMDRIYELVPVGTPIELRP